MNDDLFEKITDMAVADPAKHLTAVELAEAMLDYSRVSKNLDKIREIIKATVLRMEKTQTVGDIRATYSGGRGVFQYESTARAHPDFTQETLDKFTTKKETTSTAWAPLCAHLGIKAKEIGKIPTSGPSVSIKFIK